MPKWITSENSLVYHSTPDCPRLHGRPVMPLKERYKRVYDPKKPKPPKRRPCFVCHPTEE